MNELNRPYITCHMMTTLDGKITSANGTDILSDQYFELYTKTEDILGGADAWMLGRVTMQMFASAEKADLNPPNHEVKYEDYLAPHESNLYMVGVDTKGVLRWDKNTIKLSNVETPLNLVILVTEQTPAEYLNYLKEKGVSFLLAGKDQIDFEMLFTKLKSRLGINKLLLEGGGKLNGSVMNSGMIDEISVLITPVVLNQSTAPSMFESENGTEPNLTNYSLTHFEKLDKNTIWLRYQKQDIIAP